MNIYEMGIERGMEKGIEKGRLETLFHLVQAGRITTAEAAEEAGISEEEFIEQMNATGKL